MRRCGLRRGVVREVLAGVAFVLAASPGLAHGVLHGFVDEIVTTGFTLPSSP